MSRHQVGGQRHVAAAVADYRHPPAAWEIRHQQPLSELDHLAWRRHAEDAAGSTGGIDGD